MSEFYKLLSVVHPAEINHRTEFFTYKSAA